MEVANKGWVRYTENAWACWYSGSTDAPICITLCIIICKKLQVISDSSRYQLFYKCLCLLTADAITTVCPTSRPFIPAWMLIEFVQNTTKSPMYSLYSHPVRGKIKKQKKKKEKKFLEQMIKQFFVISLIFFLVLVLLLLGIKVKFESLLLSPLWFLRNTIVSLVDKCDTFVNSVIWL